LIDSAEDYVLMSTFMASNCDGLEDLYDAIVRKAQEGVRIYFISDGVSTYDMTVSRFHLMPVYFLRDAGVHYIEYSPVSVLRAIAPQTLWVRDHRKLVVVDGKKAVIGGMNMNYISLGSDDPIDLQRDSMYVFDSGNLAAALTDEFVILWNEASVEKIKRSDFKVYEDDPNEKDLSLKGYVFNQGPGTETDMSKMYSALINSAKDEIFLSPYLALLDDEMLSALKRAEDRGVRVRMYIPFDPRDYVQRATFYDYHKLVEAGFEVNYEYTGGETGKGLLHQKLMVVDDRYAVIGSANFNYRSMCLSYEIALCIDDEDFAKLNKEMTLERCEGMEVLTVEEAQRLKKEKGSLFNYLISFYGG